LGWGKEKLPTGAGVMGSTSVGVNDSSYEIRAKREAAILKRGKIRSGDSMKS